MKTPLNMNRININYLIIIIFGFTLMQNVCFSQSKKKQIEVLNYRVDSVKLLIQNQRLIKNSEILSLRNINSTIQKKIDSLITERKTIENLLISEQKDKQNKELEILKLKNAIDDGVILENEEIIIDVEEEGIIEFPDVEAEFIGGAQALMKYISSNIQYPPTSIEMNEQGKVYLSYVVEPDGSISNVVVERGVSPDLDKEAKRVVRSMPNWKPGESKGKKSRTRCRLPINFQLG